VHGLDVVADKRFEREVPNDLWQIDTTEVRLASGEKSMSRRLPGRPRPLPALCHRLRKPDGRGFLQVF